MVAYPPTTWSDLLPGTVNQTIGSWFVFLRWSCLPTFVLQVVMNKPNCWLVNSNSELLNCEDNLKTQDITLPTLSINKKIPFENVGTHGDQGRPGDGGLCRLGDYGDEHPVQMHMATKVGWGEMYGSLPCTVLMQCIPEVPFFALTILSFADRNMYFTPPIITPFMASCSVLAYLLNRDFNSSAVTANPAEEAQMFPSCPAITALLITLVEMSWSST